MTTTVFLSPVPAPGSPLFIPGGNQPASGGLLFTYITGSSTKLNTFTTSSGAVANSNPIVLDSGGNLTGSREVWLIQSSTYRFVLAPSTDTDPPASPYWTMDSISGVNDIATQLNANSQEWINASTSPVFSNASSFVVSGDQRQTFTVGRRVKTTNSGGTIYGTITSSAFTTSTAVGIAPDSGGLDAGLSAVSYGLLSTPDGSVPWTNITATGNTVTSNAITASSITSVVFSASTVVSTTGTFSTLNAINVSSVGSVLVVLPNVQFGANATSTAAIGLPYNVNIASKNNDGTLVIPWIGISSTVFGVNTILVGQGGAQSLLLRANTLAANPTTSQLASGSFGLFNTSSGIKFFYNNSGTMTSSSPFT